MAVLQIYHGSPGIVRRPDIERCKPHNDYGRGFYCTPDLELAKEWACQKGRDGFANSYELDADGLEVIDLDGPGFSILNWLAVLLANRLVRLSSPIMKQGALWLAENYLVDLSQADMVAGYRADDSYFGFARAFLRNEITLGQLETAIYLGNLGKQIMVKSPRAFARLAFIESTPADSTIYWPLREERELNALEEYEVLLSQTPQLEEPTALLPSRDLTIKPLMALPKEEVNAIL